VLIADDIRKAWPVAELELEEEEKARVGEKTRVEFKHMVRKRDLSHTVFFFIDYQHARPHEADIHVLLRTCLNPHRGIHLILNERTAIEWGETIRNGYFSKATDLVVSSGGSQ
jgi:hypothetical protein